MKEKRKNDIRRRFPWWGLLVAGFALGVVVTLLLVRSPQPAQNQSQQVLPTLFVGDPLLLTATAVVQEATARAGYEETIAFQAVQPTPDAWVDPFALTATRVVVQATLQAAGS